MSVWMNVTGVIWFDWFPFSLSDKKKVEEETRERYDLIKNALETNKPTGSEGPLWFKFTKNDINMVTILGSLRDFDSEKIMSEFKPWWDSLIEIPYVRQAIVSCTTNRETHIFEKRIQHDADLGEEMLKFYGPDPGIVIHTKREVKIDNNI